MFESVETNALELEENFGIAHGTHRYKPLMVPQEDFTKICQGYYRLDIYKSSIDSLGDRHKRSSARGAEYLRKYYASAPVTNRTSSTTPASFFLIVLMSIANRLLGIPSFSPKIELSASTFLLRRKIVIGVFAIAFLNCLSSLQTGRTSARDLDFLTFTGCTCGRQIEQ